MLSSEELIIIINLLISIGILGIILIIIYAIYVIYRFLVKCYQLRNEQELRPRRQLSNRQGRESDLDGQLEHIDEEGADRGGTTMDLSELPPPVYRNANQYRNVDSQLEHIDEEGAEGEGNTRDLTESPPPAYRNVSQYRNVDMEHDEVVRLRSMYRLSSHMESETLSLPPDYISTQGEDETTERLSSSVAPQEIHVPEGQLPSMYSTAHMELTAGNTNEFFQT